MSQPLTLFVDPQWKREDVAHSPLLYPFWGNALTERTPFQRELFEHYTFDTTLYRITDNPNEADMVLIPYSHNMALNKCPALIDECAARAKSLNKLLLIDGVGDIEHPITIPHAVILRYGGYRFKKDSRELHIPAYADDLLERCRGGKLTLREKSQKPVIGFAGWSRQNFFQTFKTLVKEAPIRLRSLFDIRYGAYVKGVSLRMRALRILHNSGEVGVRFIERPSYSGHRQTASHLPKELRQEFVDTIVESDYCLDVRGDANASTRLFEILSLGRIPVIVDTERNFPFFEKIDYSAFSLLVDFRDLAALPERIARFHGGLSPEAFKDMQRAARDAYVRYFRVDALMTHLVPELRKRIEAHG